MSVRGAGGGVWARLAALEHEIRTLRLRVTTEAGGGVPAAPHASEHYDGGDDEVDVKQLGGFPGGSPRTYLDSDGAFTDPGGGSDAFGRIAVSGQSDVVADQSGDTLTLAAGSNITLTTTPGSDTVTIASSASASFSGALVKKSADQTGANYSLAAGGANITFDAESYDVGGWHDNVTNNTRLTVPSGVSYVVIAASVSITNHTANQWIGLFLFKNGSTSGAFDGACGQLVSAGSATSPTVSFASVPIPVTAGDYFEVFMLVEADTSITVTGARCMFGIMKVG